MVCIYCGKRTEVINSRPQKRTNSVWRRRKCQSCGAVITTTEQVGYEQALGFRNAMSHIVPFHRDQLFLSIYEACRHRSSAIADATELTNTVLQMLLVAAKASAGVITRHDLIEAVSETLHRFDAAAATSYNAFHKSSSERTQIP